MSDFVKYEDLKIGAMYEFHVCGNVQSFKLIHKEGERFVVLKEPYKELDIWCNVASAKFKSLEDGALRDREATEFSQFLEE
ncbi:MAG: hypothetical protein GWN00_27810, partial [Aliifodinibius sp.]|nr:hypothetical protein [candidate division Zixibacteria bacterium]NIT59888.1 hypothetical protein [Fodinibius sp.]NIV14609.1 hypothetical protein [Fodinibius sp.]NIY28471.1 hypothetical protein [Fodinibius sp.]